MGFLEDTTKKVDTFMEQLASPKLDVQVTDAKEIQFKNIHEATPEQLGEYINASGGWLSYLQMKLAELKAKKSAYDMMYEADEKKAVAKLVKEAKWEKRKPNRDELIGMALLEDAALDKLHQARALLQAAYDRLEGTVHAWQQMYYTVSRIISLKGINGA